jgi:cytochrome oxidase Cu insertion factor (SCO1/SenC/PrrC family)
VLIRQNGPVFGSSNPYSPAGETQLDISTRNLRSTDHFNGTAEQLQRQTLDSYVLNIQHMVDISVTHTFTERFSMNVGVPFVAASWGIPSPTTAGDGARANEHGSGLGDISVGARMWILPTKKFTSGNVALGLGVKMPTGNSAVKDTYVDISGNNLQARYVDQSVQPGDGGWGMTVDLSGFKSIPHAQLFGSASYLINPRDRNDTTSVSVNISAAANPSLAADTSYNSVPDQYMVRLGGAVPLGTSGIAASLTWRAEGLPRYDLIGGSHGFRRPGVEMFIEPGFSYAKGGNVYSFEMPIGYYRNRFPNPYTGASGDATFPNYIFLASVGHRFGGKSDASILANRSNAPAGAAGLATSGVAPAVSVVGTNFKPFKLKTPDGAQKTLPDMLGKTTLVVFFYPTCPFCNVAAPDIQKIADTYRAQGLSVVYINILPEEAKLIKGWQTTHGYTSPVLTGASTASIQNDYDVTSTPTHYLLDAKGKVLAKHSGFQPGDEKGLEQEIKRALGDTQ